MKDATRTYKLKETHHTANKIYDHGMTLDTTHGVGTPFAGRTFGYCQRLAGSLIHNLGFDGQTTKYDHWHTEGQTAFLEAIAFELRVARENDTCRGCPENSLTAGGYCGIHDGVDHISGS